MADLDRRVAERFFELFRGWGSTHGEKVFPLGAGNEPSGKAIGYARNVDEPVTVELWERHLDGAGGYGLGVVPVDGDGLCRWGAADVDVYTLSLDALAKEAAKMRLPVIVGRTQSGGAHLLMFLTEPAPAPAVRRALAGVAGALGFGGCEIFPKQDIVEEGGYGSWLSMPYQAGRNTLRYAYDPSTGESMDAEEFLDVAYDAAVDPARLEELAALPPKRVRRSRAKIAEARDPSVASAGAGATETEEPFPEGPPCLNSLCRPGEIGKLKELHARNEVLFNVTLYYKKRDPNRASERAGRFALRLEPNLETKEASGTIASAMKRPYAYRCRNQPLAGRCDRDECETRACGVGPSAPFGADPTKPMVIGDMYKLLLEEPVYVVDVSGHRVEVSAEQLLNQRAFITKVVEKTNIYPRMVSPAAWRTFLTEKLIDCRDVIPPTESARPGVMWKNLVRYATGRAQARTVEELKLGKPYNTPDRTYFTAPEFLAWCHDQKVPVTERLLYMWLRDRGLKHEVMTLVGTEVEVWSVPRITEQSEPYQVPRDPDAGEKFS